MISYQINGALMESGLAKAIVRIVGIRITAALMNVRMEFATSMPTRGALTENGSIQILIVITAL